MCNSTEVKKQKHAIEQLKAQQHGMNWRWPWVAVWWQGLATLLPSSRKLSGSNFFLFLLTVCTVEILLLLLLLVFIIWVIIIPDISYNKEMPQVHPQGQPLPFDLFVFFYFQIMATIWSGRLTANCSIQSWYEWSTSPWVSGINGARSKQIPIYKWA